MGAYGSKITAKTDLRKQGLEIYLNEDGKGRLVLQIRQETGKGKTKKWRLRSCVVGWRGEVEIIYCTKEEMAKRNEK